MNLSRASLACSGVFAILVGAISIGVIGPTQAQVPARPFPVQSQVVDGMTLRLNDARWESSGVPSPPKTWEQDSNQHYFIVGFDLLKDGAVLPPGKTLRDTQAIRVEAVGPQGQRVQGGKFTLPDESGDYRTWADLDPRWTPLRLEFDVRDPAAPLDAGGSFTDTVIWKDVPLPTEVGKAVEINLAQTTAHGVRVWLEKARLDTDRLYFTLRWLPPEGVPDLAAKWNNDPDPVFRDYERRVEDNTGKALKPRLDHDSNRIDHSEGGRTTLQCQLPAPGATSVTINLKLDGYAPSLRQEKWFRRFRFEVPRQDIALPPATAAAEPVTSALTEDVEAKGVAKVTLERFLSASDRVFFGRLWLENRSPAPGPLGQTHAWVVRQMFWRDATGAPLEGLLNPRIDIVRPLYWKADNSPAASNEVGMSFAKPLASPPAYDKIGLEVQLEQRRSTPFKAAITGLPVPPPGTVVELNQQAELTDLGRLTVRAIGSFDATHTLTKSLALNLTNGILTPPYGLAVVLEFASATSAPVAGDQFFMGNAMYRSFAFNDIQVSDDTGRSLQRTSGWPTVNGDLLKNQRRTGASEWMTLFLLPPAPDAKHFDLHVLGTRVVAEQQQKVFLKAIPLPAPPANP